jgi:hypothetical protein
MGLQDHEDKTSGDRREALAEGSGLIRKVVTLQPTAVDGCEFLFASIA